MADRYSVTQRVADDVVLGDEVVIHEFVNLYGCAIGAQSRIGTFVEIQRGAVIGERCKISSHSFICEAVTIGDEVFIGHGVTFINDLHPRATNDTGEMATDDDWTCVATMVGRRASIGSGATILGGISIGSDAIVGAGAVVTKDVPRGAVVAGNPARELA